jgi:GT2 family glycosyltransferase
MRRSIAAGQVLLYPAQQAQHEEKTVARLSGDVAHLQRTAQAAATVEADLRAELAKALTAAAKAHGQAQAALAKLDAHTAEFRLVEAQRDQLLASTSWRATAPLRWISRVCHPRHILPMLHHIAMAGRIEALHRLTRAYRGLSLTPAQPRADPRPAVLGEASAVPGSAREFEYRPLVSVIVPVFNAEPQLLRRAVASVQAQTYPHWELCICDDGSTAAATIETLLDIQRFEPKLELRRLVASSGISTASKAALALAKGDFVAFLDDEDELTPHALEACVAQLNRDGKIDVLYSDEDKPNYPGQKWEPFFKPDWSPSLLREVMYVGHLLVARRCLIEKVGGIDPIYDEAHEFELMLRLSEHTRRIHHLREILYRRRRILGSAEAETKLGEKQVAAVNAHLARLGVAAQAQPHPKLAHRVVVAPALRQHYPRISIVVPTEDATALMSRCLDSIYARTTYPDFEVVLVENETTDRKAPAAIDRYPVVRAPVAGHFDLSRYIGAGVGNSSGQVLVLLNNETEILNGDWLDQMLFLLDEPDVAVVGPMLVYPDRSVRHAGVALDIHGTIDHVLRGQPADADGYFGALACTREVSAVTLDCLMVRRTDYDAVGGVQDLYRMDYQDVDFCLRLRAHGKRILYTPRARAIHHASATRGTADDPLDRALLLDAWGSTISAGDPYSRWDPAAREDVRVA